MSAGYRAKSATFNSVSMTDLTQMSVRKGGQVYDLIGDANANVLDVFVDNIATDITISSNDIAWQTNASIEVGDSASAVLVFDKRASGRASASADKTLTITAVVVATDFSAGSNGVGSGTITLRAAGVGSWT